MWGIISVFLIIMEAENGIQQQGVDSLINTNLYSFSDIHLVCKSNWRSCIKPQLRFLRNSELKIESLGNNLKYGDEIQSKTGANLKIIKIKCKKHKCYGFITQNQQAQFKPSNRKDIICSYTTRAESGLPNGNFDSCSAIDSSGIYYGLLQWTTHTGNLQNILWDFYKLNKTEYKKELSDYIPVKVTRNIHVLVNKNGRVYDLLELRNHKLCIGLINLASHPDMIKTQLAHVDYWYDIAKRNARRFNIRSERGIGATLTLSVALGFRGAYKLLEMLPDDVDEDLKLQRLLGVVKIHYPGRHRRTSSVVNSKTLRN